MNLGEFMKAQELATRTHLPRRSYTVIRIDGKAFHTFTRGLEKPYDLTLMSAMDRTAEALCKEIDGAVLAFTQSDEISVVLTDFASEQTEPWFGGQVQKIVSVSASIATAAFNKAWTGEGTALFDSRVFTLTHPLDVALYLLWRHRDASKNSISMTAQSRFSHRQLHGKNSDDMQEMLWNEGVNWATDMPPGFRNGRLTTLVHRTEDVQYRDKRTGELRIAYDCLRSRWETKPIERSYVTDDFRALLPVRDMDSRIEVSTA